MIDNAVWISKIVMGVVSVYLIYSASRGKTQRLIPGAILMMFAGFLTGAEMVTNSETPWSYLVLYGSEQDWSKAFHGGSMILLIPVLLLAVGGKSLAKIIEGKP